MDKEQQLKEEKIRRFKEMGIPVPMTPLNPSEIQVPVKNTAFASKLAAIKNGLKKEEIIPFIAKAEGIKEFSSNLPIPKNNKNKQQNSNMQNAAKGNAPALKEFGVESGGDFSLYEKTLLGEDNSKQSSVPNPRNFTDTRIPDESGTQFLNEFKGKFRDALHNKQRTAQEAQATIPEGYSLINDEDLTNKIISISSKISKEMIKKVLSEYISQKGKTIVESDKVKKAEVVGENLVKINGKVFKLTPVK